MNKEKILINLLIKKLEKQKLSYKKYMKTKKGKDARKRYLQKYQQTPHGKKKIKEWNKRAYLKEKRKYLENN